MLRTSLARQARTFTTRTPLFRTPLEVGKDALKKVDRVAADAAIKGLDAGGKSASLPFFGLAPPVRKHCNLSVASESVSYQYFRVKWY
jgi:hypothetical protein